VKNKIRITEGKDLDILRMAGRIRKADEDELLAATGRNPMHVLTESWIDGGRRWAAWSGDELVCVFGVALGPVISGVGSGIPWLIGTDLMEDVKKEFLKESRWRVDEWVEEFGVLYNFVDVRNTRSIRWLKWLGFKFVEETIALGPHGMPFLQFYRRKSDV